MSWFSLFAGKRDTKNATREGIVSLRETLAMLEKKEEHLQKKIDEELRKARANAVSNKPAATAALKRKKVHELELERLSGQKWTLESEVNALESANINAETMAAMKKGADALKKIHGKMGMNEVDATMDNIREEMERANEISEAISNPLNVIPGQEIDEDELKNELAELEQEQLNEVLSGAERVPVHSPGRVAAPAAASKSRAEVEDEEEAELKKLQAELAM